MNPSKSKKVELVIQQLNGLPTLPAVAARILQITVQSNTQATEVVRLIESDQSLSFKIIALASQSLRDVNRQIPSTVGKAVMMLGFEAVRNAVLSIKVFETLGGTNPSEGAYFDRTAFWKHSLAVACAARQIIPHIDRKVDPEEVFMCGLLHDMGKVALDTSLPKSYARVVELTEASVANIADVERKVLGIDHPTAGKRLAEKWNLPRSIVETIWMHHQHPQRLPDVIENRSIVQAVFLADLLVRQQRIGYSGNHPFLYALDDVAREMGIRKEALEGVARDLPDELVERSFILGLEEVDTQEMYQEALSNANEELGKLNIRLQQQNHQLRSRSKYFGLLCELCRGLRPGQSVVDVCSLIVSLWQQQVQSQQCGVFAISEDGSIYEGAVSSPSGTPEVFLVDSEERVNRHADREFNIGPVDASQNWFFESVCTDFDVSQTLSAPLYVAQIQMGGILWQSDAPFDPRTELRELEAFAACCANAISLAQLYEKQTTLCEQLVQNNDLVQQMRQELIHKQSLATIGEMAAGAAHEINNPLAVIVGRAQMLSQNESDPKRAEALELIARNGLEITDIIKSLMDFAKPAVPAQRSVSLREMLSSAAKAQADIAKQQKVELSVDLYEALPELYVDPKQISQAIGELLANAIASYDGEGGRVQLTAHMDLAEQEVIVQVIDKGRGFDEADMDKVLTPFYSGKVAGRRRGLGLCRSLRQIETNGGRLELKSKPGVGTTASVFLPVSQLAPLESTL